MFVQLEKPKKIFFLKEFFVEYLTVKNMNDL